MGLTKEQLTARRAERKLYEEREAQLRLDDWVKVGMMELLERATSIGMNISVSNGQFIVSGTDKYGDHFEYRIVSHPSGWEDWDETERLERHIDLIDEEAAAQRALAAIRKTAVSKLTKEERDALGIPSYI